MPNARQNSIVRGHNEFERVVGQALLELLTDSPPYHFARHPIVKPIASGRKRLPCTNPSCRLNERR